MALPQMNIKDARALYKRIKATCRIDVRPHAWKDHPERKFSMAEIQDLVRRGNGLHQNTLPSAIEGSFLLITTDDQGRRCEIALLFEIDAQTGDYIVVPHAFR